MSCYAGLRAERAGPTGAAACQGYRLGGVLGVAMRYRCSRRRQLHGGIAVTTSTREPLLQEAHSWK